MRCLLICVCVFVFVACQSESNGEPSATSTSTTTGGGNGGAGGAMREPMPLTVANWNVLNFFDDVNDPNPDEEADPQYGTHRADIGRVIKALGADIIALCEVEKKEVLEDLNETELDGEYPHIALVEGNDPRGIDVAVISKIPIDNVVSHADDEFGFIYARDALEVHFTFNERPIVLFSVHYKAKEMDNPAKRLAEAEHTRMLADAIVAGAGNTAVLILGDFNDLPDSPPYNATIGPSDDAFTNSAFQVPEADRYTFTFMGTEELVDHQFANPLMSSMLRVAGARILHGPEVDAASDHAPVVATYDVF